MIEVITSLITAGKMLNKLKTKNRFYSYSIVLLVTSLLVIFISTTASLGCLHALQRGKIRQATVRAQVAYPGIKLLSLVTWHQVPDLELLSSSLKSVMIVGQILEKLPKTTQEQDLLNQLNLILKTAEASGSLAEISQVNNNLAKNLEKSWLIRSQLPEEWMSAFSQIAPVIQEADLISDWLQQDQQVVFLLQNDDEIRASGGYMGSLAASKVSSGQIESPIFYDVYDLSGQITTLLPAPPGAKHYLTGGKGMNLQDANWHPDFPTAGKNITFLLNQTKLKPSLLIALNLGLIEDLLKITGPIYLPDYNTQVDDQNFSQIAHQDRDQFFPGDRQKKHFLSAAYSAIKVALEDLGLKEQQQIMLVLSEALAQQEILFYTQDKTLQSFFEKNNWAGQLVKAEQYNQVYLVESNVGINKANQDLFRKAKIQTNQTNALLILTFTNHNSPLPADIKQKMNENKYWLTADHQGYVNYQRVITSPTIKVSEASCSGQEVKLEENRTITNSKQEAFNQAGFLVVVKEQQDTRCQIKLQPTSFSQFEHSRWQLNLQPGLKDSKQAQLQAPN